VHIQIGFEQRLKEAEALDMVHVEMRQQDVDPRWHLF
jgi:hypothetical protein